jgi:hypothetical protein
MKRVTLTQDQVKYLNIFGGYKAFCRQEYLNRELGQELNKKLEAELIQLGVLKRDKRGSLRGPSYDELQALIRVNTMTIDDMKRALEEEIDSLRQTEEKDRRLTQTDPNYCFYSRDVHETIRYRKEQIAKWKKLLNEQGAA